MIVAVIPTLYRPPTLQPLLDVLAGDGIEVVLMDTTGREPDIYRWWNEGADKAREMGADHIAILNDDIVMKPGTLAAMAEVFDQDPLIVAVSPMTDQTACVRGKRTFLYTEGLGWGTEISKGLAGWCFMFPTDRPVPRFDERYRWYCGDNAFEEDLRRAGFRSGVLQGVTIEHLTSFSTRKSIGKLAALIKEDFKLWGFRPGPLSIRTLGTPSPEPRVRWKRRETKL